MAEYIEARCAVVQIVDGLVINVVIALPSDAPQYGCRLIEIMNEQPCDIGWYWDGVSFYPPEVTTDGN